MLVERELSTALKTLENLNALVDQYQEIRKPEGNASLAVQRVWKPIFIRNYQKIWWTSEGGGIDALRNMLEMHVNSINLTLQALQRCEIPTAQTAVQEIPNQYKLILSKYVGVAIRGYHRADGRTSCSPSRKSERGTGYQNCRDP